MNTLRQLTFGQLTFGQFTFGQFTFGQLTFRQFTFGQPYILSIYIWSTLYLVDGREGGRGVGRGRKKNVRDLTW